jgi:hypothetical protein
VSDQEFAVFPAERMNADFPWQIWAVGWLAIFKAILWLAYEPVLPEPILQILAYKYALGAVPWLVFGIGVWNMRRWAMWGICMVAVADLVLLVTNLQMLNAFVVESEVRLYSLILSFITLLCNGPLGDILILLAIPAMRKHMKKT